jgi:hypothetical protein
MPTTFGASIGCRSLSENSEGSRAWGFRGEIKARGGGDGSAHRRRRATQISPRNPHAPFGLRRRGAVCCVAAPRQWNGKFIGLPSGLPRNPARICWMSLNGCYRPRSSVDNAAPDRAPVGGIRPERSCGQEGRGAAGASGSGLEVPCDGCGKVNGINEEPILANDRAAQRTVH